MENTVIYIIYIIIGGVIGLVFSLLFFRMDEGWKKIGTFIFGAGSSGGIFVFLNWVCDITDKNMKNNLLAVMLMCVVILAAISFKILCGLLKGQDGNNVIRVLDIVLGQKDFMENYYATRKREIDSKLNLDEIEEKSHKLESREKDLINFEDELKKREKYLDMQIQNGIYLNLPERQKIPVTSQFLLEFPEYVETYSKYINHIRKHTQEFECELKERGVSSERRKILLEAYFLGICTFTIADIFQGLGSNKIRVHFRILDEQEEYIKLVATTGRIASAKELTPIPLGKANMISQSYKNRTSMIKSLNIQYHFGTNNEQVWNEYLTYTFDDLLYKGYPFLSFGISVKNKDKYENLFYFLNFCKIEYILQESIDKIRISCDIINIISGGL